MELPIETVHIEEDGRIRSVECIETLVWSTSFFKDPRVSYVNWMVQLGDKAVPCHTRLVYPLFNSEAESGRVQKMLVVVCQEEEIVPTGFLLAGEIVPCISHKECISGPPRLEL